MLQSFPPVVAMKRESMARGTEPKCATSLNITLVEMYPLDGKFTLRSDP